MPDVPAEVTLDVHPMLNRGEEPFGHILERVATLLPGQSLRLLAPFRPLPLLHVMNELGYSNDMRELAPGHWEVLFTPSAPRRCGATKTSDSTRD